MTLHLSDLNASEQEALAALYENMPEPTVDPGTTEDLANLTTKLQNYMQKNGHTCVKTVVNVDGEPTVKYLRLVQTSSVRKLTTDAIEQAIADITPEVFGDHYIKLSQRAKKAHRADPSFEAVVTDLIFIHIRQYHYTHSTQLKLMESCERGGKPHEASERSAVVIQQYYNLKHKQDTVRARKRDVASKRDRCGDILQGVFERNPAANHHTVSFQNEDGKEIPMVLSRKVRARPTRVRINAVKERVSHIVSQYRDIDTLRRESRAVADAVIQWIQTQQAQQKAQVSSVRLDVTHVQ